MGVKFLNHSSNYKNMSLNDFVKKVKSEDNEILRDALKKREE